MKVYSINDYVTDIKNIVNDKNDITSITDKIKPLSSRFASEKSWFKESFREVDKEQGFGLHLLHEEENHDLAVFIIAWAPGKGLSPHNHKTWAVVTGMEGQEHETTYERLDDGNKKGFADLRKLSEHTLYPGQTVCCMPEDIHSVWNNGTKISLSLHTYGRHLNYTGRSIFDVKAKTESPCIVKIQK